VASRKPVAAKAPAAKATPSKPAAQPVPVKAAAPAKAARTKAALAAASVEEVKERQGAKRVEPKQERKPAAKPAPEPEPTAVIAAPAATPDAMSPEHLVQPADPLPPAKLSELPAWLQDSVLRAGWQALNPVQAYSMPYLIAGRDMMVQARTGSGKTGAFLLPILQLIDSKKAKTQALIMVPTRELALQVQREAEKLVTGSTVRTVAVYGGVGYGPQLEALRAGAHVVVGTPGRILDHLMRRSMDLNALQTLIFDEADRMLSMGFYPDMLALKRYLPGRQCGFMFSATYPETVRSLARQFLHEPSFLSLSHDQVHVADTDHVYYETPAMEKDRCLARILEVENPESAIIFCNTKVRVNYVATILARYGYDADQMTADLAQKDRERVLEKLRTKKLRFLVATDLAGRGIDVPKMSHVIQYEFPDDQESYIHRAGRTGRAGAPGVAITLVNELERSLLQRVAVRYSIDLERREVPDDEMMGALLRDRVVAALEGRLRRADNLRLERLRRFVPLVRTLALNDEEVDVLAMLLFEEYEKSLQETPPAPAPGEVAPRRERGPRPERTPRTEAPARAPEPSEEKPQSHVERAPAAAPRAPKPVATPTPAPAPAAPPPPPASGDKARRKVRSLNR